eukprot:m.440377 g.440377  ORF g.440377 m.440377 type:complete len:260 (-) comp20278_c2_seq5:720-1499(-)
MSNVATLRLKKELAQMIREPNPQVRAMPLAHNILEWHYVIFPPDDSPYKGGQYHGKLIFPPQYPFKPPGVMMLTPNGRFKTNMRLCLSMSDFHPETWQPSWSVSSILVGLLSFMLESSRTTGSIETTTEEKHKFALQSRAVNAQNPVFKDLFPDLCEGVDLSLAPAPAARVGSAAAAAAAAASVSAEALASATEEFAATSAALAQGQIQHQHQHQHQHQSHQPLPLPWITSANPTTSQRTRLLAACTITSPKRTMIWRW